MGLVQDNMPPLSGIAEPTLVLQSQQGILEHHVVGDEDVGGAAPTGQHRVPIQHLALGQRLVGRRLRVARHDTHGPQDRLQLGAHAFTGTQHGVVHAEA